MINISNSLRAISEFYYCVKLFYTLTDFFCFLTKSSLLDKNVPTVTSIKTYLLCSSFEKSYPNLVSHSLQMLHILYLTIYHIQKINNLFLSPLEEVDPPLLAY